MSTAETEPPGRRPPPTETATPGGRACSTRSSTRAGSPATRSSAPLAKDLIGEFVDQVMAGDDDGVDRHPGHDQRADRADRRADLRRSSTRSCTTTSSRSWKRSWRGLHYLVHQTETGTQLKIRVLNVSKKDLLKDMERAAEFDQSALFKKIYEEEFGTFGGDPVRRAGRRLRVRPSPAGHGAAGEDLERRRRGARAVHLGGQPAAVQLGRLHRADRARAI